ncbi:MAG: hypothetical protein K5860_01195 [Bacteroidales bacterium]|nr:hypothetical protein [Bacteroidales bacterium]
MVEIGFEKFFVIIDDKFEIEKSSPSESDILKKLEGYEKTDFGNLIVCKNPKSSGKSLAVISYRKTDCQILNYKSL